MIIKLLLFKFFSFLSRYYTQAYYISKYKRDLKRKEYKYFHILNNGLHSKPVLDFINKHFDNREHCFLISRVRDKNLEFLDVSNVYQYPLACVPLDRAEKIVFHGLFTPTYIEFLYDNPEFLDKSYWFIWGGDLYTSDDKKSTYVKRNVKGILTAFDYEVYREKFGDKQLFDVTYPSRLPSAEALNAVKKEKTVSILVNNSADETTLEMLDILSKFKDEDIKVYTILSYVSANQKDVRLYIMKKGYELFGDKFCPIIDYMPREEYTEFQNGLDIYISNQDRQQGNGNASYLLALGRKVYVKSDTSVYKRYQKEGITYFDTYTIPQLSFEEFVSYDEDVKRKSIDVMFKRAAEETKVKQWQSFFDA